MKKLAIFLFLIAASVNSLFAEEADVEIPMSAGVYLGVNLNMHSPDFNFFREADSDIIIPELQNSYSMNFAENSTNMGLNFGGIFNYPIDKNFVFSGRIGYNNLSGDLSLTKIVDVDQNIFDDISGDLESSISYIEISPMMQFHNLLPMKRIYFLAGLEFGIPMSASYTEKEHFRIDEPNETIVNRKIAETDIPETNIRFALALGAGYVIDLDEKTKISPEISFRIPFSNISGAKSFDSWGASQLRIGASITFSLTGPKEAPKSSALDVGFTGVNYYDKKGNKYPLEKIKIEEVQYSELFPLIPYVFCEEGSAFPSEDTQALIAEEESGAFGMNILKSDAMSINTHTLDIIGTRMRQLPRANLTVTGTNDNKSEKGKMDLSAQRAEFAKNYIVVNYGINPERIKVKLTGLPENASAVNDPDGIQENRRIEFSSNLPELLEAIKIDEEKQALATPDLIEIQPSVSSTDSVTKWQLEISQGSKTIKVYEGEGTPKAQNWAILPDQLSANEIPVEYTFTAESEVGLKDSKTGTIPVEFKSLSRTSSEEKADKIISKFSLLVFDFDKSEVSDHDKKIIEEHVLPAIKYNSIIQIYGYTDRIGNGDYNQKLAEKRAEAVKNIIKAKVPSAKFEVYGVGENVELFPNDNPVGRHLSRTVQIYVLTPKN